MKKIIITLAATTFTAVILLTSCNSLSKKIENAGDKLLDAKEPVVDAKIELNDALQDSVTDFQQFKTEFKNQISANEKSITALKLSIVDASREYKIHYEKKIAELEKRNNELKIELAEYKEGGADQWQIFKTEFKSDMDELGNAFSDFTVSDKE